MVQRFESVEESTRVGEYVVARVGERDVAHAECGELAQCTEGVTELVAPVCGVRSQGETLKREGRDRPFYTNERGNLATPHCADDVVCREREFKCLS
jgi:hypothetical protein